MTEIVSGASNHHPKELALAEPRRPPRRMKSLSEAIDLIGTSFHNRFHHSSSKKKSTEADHPHSNSSNDLESMKEPKVKARTKRSTSIENGRLKSLISKNKSIHKVKGGQVQGQGQVETTNETIKVAVEPPTPTPDDDGEKGIQMRFYVGQNLISKPPLIKAKAVEEDPNSTSEALAPPTSSMEKSQSMETFKSSCEGSPSSQKRLMESESLDNKGQASSPGTDLSSRSKTLPRDLTPLEDNTASPDSSTQGESGQLLPPGRKNRSASMMWVDYLTEEGIEVNGDLLDESGLNTPYYLSSEDETEVDIPNPNEKLSPTAGQGQPEPPADILRSLNAGPLVSSTPSLVPSGLDKKTDVSDRNIWFGEAIASDGEDDFVKRSESMESSSDLSPIANFHRRIRRGSFAPSLRSARTPDPAQLRRNVDDLIFDMFQEKDEEIIVIGNFLLALEKTGLRRNDPRLFELFENLRRAQKEAVAACPKRASRTIESLRLTREAFKGIITDNIVLISKAFRQQFVIPEFPTFCMHIEEMYLKCKGVTGGKNADYIPQLARVNPDLWGVSICTIDGQRYSIGDTHTPFTIQSCSKPLTYAMALHELGEDIVHSYVGQEPSGRMFNELVLDHNKKPHNPMVNAGAIITCSLLKSMVKPEMTRAEIFDYTHNYFKRLCGGDYVGFNNAVFLSERSAADRNYALGFYMRENKCFPPGANMKECLDFYVQVCSMECDCEAMSVMAATLANGGICPVTGEKVLNPESVRDVLSLMHSCGMYDYSGQFAFKVGLPAKSGVCGAILLVVPNVLGMAVWSPPLDVLGNTVRGVEFCKEFVNVFNFHKYDNLRHATDKMDPRRHRYETKGLNIVNLLFSAASGDVTSMRRHHLSGMDMNAADYDGRTALHLAAAEGHLECVEYLLKQCRVPHNKKDRWGNVPVSDAERFEHKEVAEFLRNWALEHPDPS